MHRQTNKSKTMKTIQICVQKYDETGKKILLTKKININEKDLVKGTKKADEIAEKIALHMQGVIVKTITIKQYKKITY